MSEVFFLQLNDLQKAELYEKYKEKVHGYIQNKVNNYHLAEDLCSDVFVKIYEKIDTFDESKASVSTWIFTIARNTLIDYYRTRKIQSEIPETLAQESSVEDDICNNEMLDTLAGALEKLDERQRDIVVLRYYSGLTLKNIAEKMDISYSYVKLLHNNAMSELKNFLEI